MKFSEQLKNFQTFSQKIQKMSVNRVLNYTNDPKEQTVTYYETLEEVPWPIRLIKT